MNTPSPAPAPPTEDGPYRVERTVDGWWWIRGPTPEPMRWADADGAQAFANRFNAAHAAGRASAASEIAALRGGEG